MLPTIMEFDRPPSKWTLYAHVKEYYVGVDEETILELAAVRDASGHRKVSRDEVEKLDINKFLSTAINSVIDGKKKCALIGACAVSVH